MSEQHEWWARSGHHHVTPRGERTPERYEPGLMALGLLRAWSVPPRYLELGCGDGRLAAHFPPSDYLGLDVSEINLRAARKANPLTDFRLYSPWEELPESEAVILWNVALHVPDDRLNRLAWLCRGRWVLLAEVMDERWRDDITAFNRDEGAYLQAFADHSLRSSVRSLVPRYQAKRPGTSCTVLVMEPTR